MEIDPEVRLHPRFPPCGHMDSYIDLAPIKSTLSRKPPASYRILKCCANGLLCPLSCDVLALLIGRGILER